MMSITTSAVREGRTEWQSICLHCRKGTECHSVLHAICNAALILLLTVTATEACIVCVADPMERVLVTALRESEGVVYGRPVADGEGARFAVTKVLKSGEGLEAGAEVKAALPLFY
jgi:hypothetical protein